MRAVLVGLALFAATAVALAQRPYTSTEGKYSAQFPGTPRVSTQTARSPIGELKVTTATYATAEGNVCMVSYTDFPAEAVKPELLNTFFDGLSTGVQGKDGKLVGEEKKLEFGPDKLPGRELIVDKGKQRIRLWAVLCGTRLYQVAVLGTPEFVASEAATAFLNSFTTTR